VVRFFSCGPRWLAAQCFAVVVFLLLPARLSADNAGDWYDNRDGGHTSLNNALHPGAQAMSSGFGPQVLVVRDRVVVGNASLAIVGGDSAGSLARSVLLTTQFAAGAVYEQYTRNNVYWYPEHLDHDAIDQFHAMSPCVGVSQGSSGSEIDEVHKWFYTLAAFPAETKERLVRTGLLMPTVQMISRRTRVATDAEYLSGAAHPTAFDDADNQAAMEALAAAMPPDRIPPLVRLRIVDDGFDGVRGVDFFEREGVSEALFTTPASIARIFRGRERTKRLVVSAEDSLDANGRPLTYHWSVLRGDPAAVRIEPLNPAASRVRVEVDYHVTTTITGSSRETNLVVVGAFAHNGYYWSAPAFVTSFTLRNESREYDAESGRLLRVDYGSGYVHAAVSTPKAWLSDAFVYAPSGELRGWVRRDAVGATAEFSADGLLVVEGELLGSIVRAQRVTYSLDPAIRRLVWTASAEETPPDVQVSLRQTARRCDGVEARLTLTSSCPVSGFDLAVGHDPAVLTARSITPAGAALALRSGEGPEVWIVDVAAGGCEAAAAGSVRMVGSLSEPAGATLPPGVEVEVATLAYDRADPTGPAAASRLDVIDCGGGSVVRCLAWGGIRPERRGAGVFLPAACESDFVRGDCNADGGFDISDAVLLLVQLFDARRASGPLRCQDACDGDDDGALTVTDAVVFLRNRFNAGAPLPPPSPACGDDESRDRLGCEQHAGCP
jgi:hypothetical protein